MDINELRYRVENNGKGGIDLEEIHELLDRLEAAEKSDAESIAMYHRARDERDALRAKIEQMEKQRPVAKVRVHRTGGNAGLAWSVAPLNDFDSLPLMRDGEKLYALPGAQAQNVPKAVAYLDLGTGGYMDIGTDLTDEELAGLPKGRHMLGVIGTYGVDGYVPAQSVPAGWLPVPEKHPTFDPVDLQLSDGSVLCGCVPQSDGDYWWEGPSGEVFIDPKYASVTHWRLAAAPEAKP